MIYGKEILETGITQEGKAGKLLWKTKWCINRQ